MRKNERGEEAGQGHVGKRKKERGKGGREEREGGRGGCEKRGESKEGKVTSGFISLAPGSYLECRDTSCC